MKDIGLEAGVKGRGSYGWRDSGDLTVRCGRRTGGVYADSTTIFVPR